MTDRPFVRRCFECGEITPNAPCRECGNIVCSSCMLPAADRTPHPHPYLWLVPDDLPEMTPLPDARPPTKGPKP